MNKKSIPFRIFIIVLLTGIIGVAGMMVQKYNMDKISASYREIINDHVTNRETTKQIMASLYEHEAVIANHILAQDDASYEKYETRGAWLQDVIREELDALGVRMQGNEREQLYHKVYSNCYSYFRNVDLVLEMSKSDNKEMAIYYMNTSMSGFLEDMDQGLSELADLTEEEMELATDKMNRLLTVSRISELVCITCIVVAVIFCLLYCVKMFTRLERAKAEAEVQRQKADAANHSKSLFLAKMSHEIRTPINAIIGMNEMILREENRPEIQEYALDVKYSADTLLSTINDILDLSKIEAGKMELVNGEYELGSLIHDVMSMISIKAMDKNLEVRLSLQETLPIKLYGDEVRIRQILINILNNAVKYTEKGYIEFAISGEKEGEKVRLHFSVRDTGIGIKEEDLSKLFSEFERIEEHRNRNVEGTGLGMSICLQLLAMMDSRLQVESVYGEGSCFSFDLVQTIRDEEPIGNLATRMKQQAKAYSYENTFTAETAKILVVDDTAVNRKVFRNLLKDTKAQIYEAASGEECISLVREYTFDLIFLDYMMPGMDGIETMHCMKAMPDNQSARAVVIALTANAIKGAKEMYLSEGFSDYLTKPIALGKLEQMIMNYLPKEKLTILKKADSDTTEPASVKQPEKTAFNYDIKDHSMEQLVRLNEWAQSSGEMELMGLSQLLQQAHQLGNMDVFEQLMPVLEKRLSREGME